MPQLQESRDKSPEPAQALPGAGHVVVTGASAGIGRAVALAFGRRGWRVTVLARGRAGLDAAAAEIEAAGGSALVIQADVGDAQAVFAAAQRASAHFGPIDIWVNNAMATVFGPVGRVPPAEWEKVTRTNYLGAVHGTLAALKHMRARNRGTIVQIGSALAYRAIALQAPYCATKFAIRGFTDALRSELDHDASAVRLTMVQLPGVNTPQFEWSRTHMPRRHRPVGAWYQPEAIAEKIVGAALRAPRELWIGRPAIEAIVGSMLLPGFLDHYLARTAYEQQMSKLPAGAGEGILFEPAPQDHGAHGPFDEGAQTTVFAAQPALLRAGLGLAALGALALAFLAGGRAASDRQRSRAVSP